MNEDYYMKQNSHNASSYRLQDINNKVRQLDKKLDIILSLLETNLLQTTHICDNLKAIHSPITSPVISSPSPTISSPYHHLINSKKCYDANANVSISAKCATNTPQNRDAENNYFFPDIGHRRKKVSRF